MQDFWAIGRLVTRDITALSLSLSLVIDNLYYYMEGGWEASLTFELFKMRPVNKFFTNQINYK